MTLVIHNMLMLWFLFQQPLPITLTTGGSECKRVYNSRDVRFPVEISGLTDLLLLYDLRSGLGDAAFYEISLNFEFLLRAHVHHGIEGQVAG